MQKSNKNDVMLDPIFIKKTGCAISTPSAACKYITPTTFEVAPEYYNTPEWAFNSGCGGTISRNPAPVSFKKEKLTITKKKVAKKPNPFMMGNPMMPKFPIKKKKKAVKKVK